MHTRLVSVGISMKQDNNYLILFENYVRFEPTAWFGGYQLFN